MLPAFGSETVANQFSGTTGSKQKRSSAACVRAHRGCHLEPWMHFVGPTFQDLARPQKASRAAGSPEATAGGCVCVPTCHWRALQTFVDSPHHTPTVKPFANLVTTILPDLVMCNILFIGLFHHLQVCGGRGPGGGG